MTEELIDNDLGSIEERRPYLWAALLPVLALICLLVANVILYGDGATGGPNQVALLLAAAVAAVVGMCLGIKFKKMQNGIVKSLGSALGAVLILLMIGALAGTWFISGIVPAMIYYGLQILSPQIFLVATVVICAVVSVATGSSWSTVATVGVALLGIGEALEVSTAITAGAVISGAYFGDKLSPLSDTTNLAAAMAGTDLFTHVKYMLWTTIPSITIASVIFLVIGLFSSGDFDASRAEELSSVIEQKFNLTPWLILVPVTVLVMVLMKFDALVALFVGAVLGGVFAVVFQPAIVEELALKPTNTVAAFSGQEFSVETTKNSLTTIDLAPTEQFEDGLEILEFEKVDSGVAVFVEDQQVLFTPAEDFVGTVKMGFKTKGMDGTGDWHNLKIEVAEPNRLISGYSVVVNAMADSTSISTGNETADGLLSGKGMAGMLSTIWLIICAMCFGGVMEACGLLQRITSPLVGLAKTTGSLIATTVGSCIFLNLTASDQYLAIVVPGRMFKETFAERGLAPQNLSRTLEDSGTVTSVLIPWNTCGATQSGVLGVSTLAYAPYCFFNLLSPMMTLIFAFAGLKIAELKAEEKAKLLEEAANRLEGKAKSQDEETL